jgi:hypothetical protein
VTPEDAAAVRHLLDASHALELHASFGRIATPAVLANYQRAVARAFALPYVSGPPAGGDVHVDWVFTRAEWADIAGILLGHGDFPVIAAMIAAGALPNPFPADEGPGHEHP